MRFDSMNLSPGRWARTKMSGSLLHATHAPRLCLSMESLSYYLYGGRSPRTLAHANNLLIKMGGEWVRSRRSAAPSLIERQVLCRGMGGRCVHTDLPSAGLHRRLGNFVQVHRCYSCSEKKQVGMGGTVICVIIIALPPSSRSKKLAKKGGRMLLHRAHISTHIGRTNTVRCGTRTQKINPSALLLIPVFPYSMSYISAEVVEVKQNR